MRERQRELADVGDVVIEGRDIGTVVAPDARGEGLPRRRSRSARAAPRGGAARTSARTRSRPTSMARRVATACRMQPAADAEGSTRPYLEVDDVVDRIEDLVRARSLGCPSTAADLAWGSRLGGARSAGDAPIWRRRRWLRPRPDTDEGGQLLTAINHFSMDRRAARRQGSRRATVSYIAKVEAHRAPARAAPRWRSALRRAPRRVRSRRCAADAADGRDGRALGVFVEGTSQRAASPGRLQPGAAMVAIQEGVPMVCDRRLRHAVLEARQLQAVSRSPWGEPFCSKGWQRAGAATRRARTRSRRRLRVLFDLLAACTGSAARGEVPRPPRPIGRVKGQIMTGIDNEQRAPASAGRQPLIGRWRSSGCRTSASRR